MSDVEQPTGWVKPQRAPTYDELQQRIQALRNELAELERQAADLRETARLEALARIRNIMRAQQLTIEDVFPDWRPGRRR